MVTDILTVFVPKYSRDFFVYELFRSDVLCFSVADWGLIIGGEMALSEWALLSSTAGST